MPTDVVTVDLLLEEVGAAGCRLELRDGGPRLVGDRTRISPTMLAVLRWRREEIISRLAPPPLEPVPDIVYWLMASGVVLVSLPGHERRSVARMRVPHGAESFRARADAPWRPLLELPAHWGLVAQGPPAATPITPEEEADTDT